MAAVVCACLTDEVQSINIDDWVNYHIDEGFKHVFLYCTSKTYKTIQHNDCVHNAHLTIVIYDCDIYNMCSYKQECKNDFGFKFKNAILYIWCAFINFGEYARKVEQSMIYLSEFGD